MGLTPGTEVYHVVLVHYEDGAPVQLADRYVNPAVAPEFIDQDFAVVPPAEYLLSVAPVSQVEHVIEAVLADKKSQTLLDLKKNTPCLLLYRTTWSGETVATHSRLTYPGPRYRLGGRFQPGSSTRCPVL
jgi:GntR family histidine utilization transcriptional repressor